jgi:hypothetical protein
MPGTADGRRLRVEATGPGRESRALADQRRPPKTPRIWSMPSRRSRTGSWRIRGRAELNGLPMRWPISSTTLMPESWIAARRVAHDSEKTQSVRVVAVTLRSYGRRWDKLSACSSNLFGRLPAVIGPRPRVRSMPLWQVTGSDWQRRSRLFFATRSQSYKASRADGGPGLVVSQADGVSSSARTSSSVSMP